MSLIAYVKRLIDNGEGKFNIVRLEAETEAELNQKRDTYLASDYQDATEEEYNAESAERDARQGTENGAEVEASETVGETVSEATAE